MKLFTFDAEIGETISYDLVVTVPEGIVNDVIVTDQIPTGMAFIGASIVTAATDSAYISNNFAGSVAIAGTTHPSTPALLGEDGQDVVIADKKIGLNGQFEAGRPAGIAPGSELWVPLAINFGPLPLEAGKRFTWTLSINGETSEHWTARFSTRPEKPKKV